MSCQAEVVLCCPCRCAEAAEGIVAALDARLLALAKHQEGAGEDAAAAFAPTATQALILGRVALGMASRSSMLPLVLGPPDQWRTAARGGADAGTGSRRAAVGARLATGSAAAAGAPAGAPSARFEQLQRRLHSVGLQAYSTWADWSSDGLVASLAAGLAADQALAADTPLRSWEETVIGGGEGAAGADGGAELAMRFQLPAAPSPAAMQLALAACQEADRAGGPCADVQQARLACWGSCMCRLARHFC